MTLLRTSVILAGGLALMLPVVMLRAETARLHEEISRLEGQAERLHLSLRAAELEHARLRNPMLIRRKVDEALGALRERVLESGDAARGEGAGR
jgi:hypothetical protein